jgi:electron transfer flavoprotein alpha subunit
MLRARSIISCCRRTYATVTSPHALVFLEHKNGTIESGSLSALTAAQQLGGTVTGLVLGGPDQVPTVLERAKKYLTPPCPSFNF